MASKKKGLGKGLDALLGDAFASAAKTRKINQADAQAFAPTKSAPAKTKARRSSGLSGELEALNGNSDINSSEKPVLKKPKLVESEALTSTEIDLANGTVNPYKATGENTAAPTGDNRLPALKANALIEIPVELCQRGKYQPRRDIDSEALEELAASIAQQGVMQPIILRALVEELVKPGQPGYEIIAGERRWRAAQLAGLSAVPAIIKEVPDEAAMAMALVENLQREDLNPMEEAYALSRLNQEFELTHQQVADIVGKSRAAVSNSLRLMNLHKDVKVLLEHGDIEMGHARALLGLASADQSEAAKEVVNRGLTVRQTEALVKNRLSPKAAKQAAADLVNDPNISRLQNDLSDKLGVPVALKHGANGRGKVILKYNSLDELDGILSHIK